MIRLIAILALLVATVPVAVYGDDPSDPSLAKVAAWRESGFDPKFRLLASERKELIERLIAASDGSDMLAETAIVASSLVRDTMSVELTDEKRAEVTSLAWTFLVVGRVLREGMTREQVAAVIGKLGSIDDLGNRVWVCGDTGPRPVLTAELDSGGRTVSFTSTFR